MSTVRAYNNSSKRISTGRTMKDGSFLQFFPKRQGFKDERAWRDFWMNASHVTFQTENEVAAKPTPKPVAKPAAVPPPVPSRNQTVTVTTRTTTTKTTTVKKDPQCCVCFGRMGQDHRMCIGEMIHSGIPNPVNEWYIRSGVRTQEEEEEAPPASPPPAPKSSPVAPPAPKKAEKTPSASDWNFKEVYRFEAPPGTYYIGDLCYFLHDKLYDAVYGGHGYESGLYTQKNGDPDFFMVDNTAYGDGCYNGSDGFEYGVDAGIIGIASRNLGPKDDSEVYGGQLHTFKDPVEIKFKNGVFRFNSRSKYLIIDTEGSTYNSDEDW